MYLLPNAHVPKDWLSDTEILSTLLTLNAAYIYSKGVKGCLMAKMQMIIKPVADREA